MIDQPRVPILTIDGPSGVGKGTVCLQVAQQLQWHYLDSGALYRSVAVVLERDQVQWDSTPAVIACAQCIHVSFTNESPLGLRVIVNGVDATDALRSEAAGAVASRIAVIPEVRLALVAHQRAFKRPPGLVADGRDMGTVIFPEAQCKVFLTASVQERANRRYRQLMGKDVSINLESLLSELAVRDARDTQRTNAPLRPAEDAVVIDTTERSIESVVAQVLELVRQSGLR